MAPEEHKAWLCDLDGTLYHPTPVKLAMAVEVVLFGWNVVATLRAFRSFHETVRAQSETGDPFRRQIELAARRVGSDAPSVESIVRAWMVDRPGRWLHLFRRRELLAEIAAFQASGGKCGLVSDYPATPKLAALGASHLFDVVVASGEAGGPTRLKPDPEGYLLAAERLDVAPSDCLVLGDRDDADGEAARRAGMAFRKIG